MSVLAGLFASNVVTANVLAPVLALLPASSASVSALQASAPASETAALVDAPVAEGQRSAQGEDAPLSFEAMAAAVQAAQRVAQVRIEQRVIIRVAPSAPSPRLPRRPSIRDLRSSFFDTPGHGGSVRLSERRMAQCVPVSAIAGVQPQSGRLLLFMRDQRVVSANLERACRARDFYSGFLVERTSDGMICAGRDKLLSRSGMNCALGRLSQLVADEDP